MEAIISKITFSDIIKIVSALFVIAQIIINLTPTKEDDNVFTVAKKIFDFIVPNAKDTDELIKIKEEDFHNENFITKLFNILKKK